MPTLLLELLPQFSNFSGIIYIAGSKVGAVVFLIATVFIYGFLDDLVPKTAIKENKKTELVQEIEEIKEYSET